MKIYEIFILFCKFTCVYVCVYVKATELYHKYYFIKLLYKTGIVNQKTRRTSRTRLVSQFMLYSDISVLFVGHWDVA